MNCCLGANTECYDPLVFQRALTLCRGIYQENLVRGYERLSGATLKGMAKSYSYHYGVSRKNLLTRLEKAGIKVSERKGSHGRRILVLS